MSPSVVLPCSLLFECLNLQRALGDTATMSAFRFVHSSWLSASSSRQATETPLPLPAVGHMETGLSCPFCLGAAVQDMTLSGGTAKSPFWKGPAHARAGHGRCTDSPAGPQPSAWPWIEPFPAGTLGPPSPCTQHVRAEVSGAGPSRPALCVLLLRALQRRHRRLAAVRGSRVP